MLAENLQRAALAPLEEARAFARLRQAGRSQRDIAARLGCAQSQVSKRLALLDLPPAAQAAVDAGRLPLADAAEILRLRKYPGEMAEVADELLRNGRPMYTGERLRAAVDAELHDIEARENTRRLLAQAEARGARILDPARGELPPYPLRRLLRDPAEIDAAGLAGALGAYVSGDGSICYLDLAAADSEPGGASVFADAGHGEPGHWPGDDDGDGPDVVSGGGITVRRVEPDQPPPAAPTSHAAARREAAAEREQRDAAEVARDEVCQQIVARFATDPATVPPFLAGHVLSDSAGDGFSYADTGRVEGWLACAGLAVFEENDEPEVFGWLDRTADPASRLLAAGALALAAAERRLTQHAAYGAWDVHDLAHLDRLVAAGHTLIDWEQRRADQVHATCTATGGCPQPYGHPGGCDQVLAGAADAEPA